MEHTITEQAEQAENAQHASQRKNVFARLLAYLMLSKNVSDFEENYLRKMNKIALIFFYWHVPVFALIAYFNSTGALLAIVLTSATLVGPSIAYRTFESQRALAATFGFTAMCMGGLLVHFGQGPVQIEMHFYFFSLLAMLALFGNPMAIVVAAVTVALHHLVFWIFLPASVFNYDAPIWVVLVHAAFVVLETCAVCYIARNFFDNVIGLEKIVRARTKEVQQRNNDMRLVLNNVGQGFLTMDMQGHLAEEHSAIVDDWLGAYGANDTFWDFVGRSNTEAGVWFELGWESVCDGMLPLELSLDQLPKKMTIESKHYRFDYTPILKDDEIEKLLIVISDITSIVAREQAETEQRETLVVFEKILADKAGFLEFYAEANRIVAAITSESWTDLGMIKRLIHTLKGNCGIFGLTTVATLCHAIEDHMNDEERPPSKDEIATLSGRWERLCRTLNQLLGEETKNVVELRDEDYDAILKAVLEETPKQELTRMITDWKLEPTEVRLQRIAEQARALALRMNKGDIQVNVEPEALRLDPERFTDFWAAFIHVIRNAVDHGLESPDERTERDKPENGRLDLRTYIDTERDEFVLEVQDDGGGIDWQAVQATAQERGLPYETQEDLKEALFADGISTKQEVTDMSGRGVGLGAVRKACQALGGRVMVETKEGEGTEMQFRFPAEVMADYPEITI